MTSTEQGLLSDYGLFLDEINALTAGSYLNVNRIEGVERVKQVEDDILSMLITAYLLGVAQVGEMLNTNITADAESMIETIYAVIEGETFADRVQKYVNNNDLAGLQKLANAEAHRVYSAAAYRSALNIQRKSGKAVKKTWYTVNDNKVRDTHQYLNGVSIGLSERFYTFDGDYASSPSNFTRAENNVGCRCWVIYRFNAM